MKVNKDLKLIAPLWYEKIKNTESMKDLLEVSFIRQEELKVLNICFIHCCIVGETYHFTDEYKYDRYKECDECDFFSRLFYNFVEEGNKDTFNIELYKFVNHVKDKHPDLIK